MNENFILERNSVKNAKNMFTSLKVIGRTWYVCIPIILSAS